MLNPPLNESTALSSSRIAREVLRVGGVGSSEEHDRGDIVGREVALEEAMEKRARPQRLVGIDFVQRDDIDAPFVAVVGEDVRFDGSGGDEWTLSPLDGDVHERKRGDGLRPAVFEDLEVVHRQVGDGISFRIGHEGIELDGIDLYAERRLGALLWLAPQDGGGTDRKEDAEGDTSRHGISGSGAGVPDSLRKLGGEQSIPTDVSAPLPRDTADN